MITCVVRKYFRTIMIPHTLFYMEGLSICNARLCNLNPHTRMGEYYEPFVATPNILIYSIIKPKTTKKGFKSTGNHFGLSSVVL